MNIITDYRPLFDSEQTPTGYIITARINRAITAKEKAHVEQRVQEDAAAFLAPSRIVHVFSCVETDTARIIILLEFKGALPDIEIGRRIDVDIE